MDVPLHKGQVPLVLVKSVMFLEAITNFSSLGLMKNGINDNLIRTLQTANYILKESDLCGIVNLVAQTLLAEGNHKRLLPQTTLTLTMISIKFLNNVGRLNMKLLQNSLSSQLNLD